MAPDPDAPHPPSAFALTLAHEIGDEEDPLEIIESIFVEGGAGMLYGASNTGKTFLALNIAASVASGKAWRGKLTVERGAVVYIALEGEGALKNRIKALIQDKAIEAGDPLFICRERVSLMDSDHIEKLVQTVNDAVSRSQVKCKLVILDTMARAMAGHDENSGTDMSQAIAAIDALRRATGAFVLVVHHCGKDSAKGARGHSSLRAGIDTEIEISKGSNSDVVLMRITKQRDLEYCAPMPFRLETLNLGRNRRNRIITSCVVRHEDEVASAEELKPGRPQKLHADVLLHYLPAENKKDWLAKASSKIEISRSSFYALTRELQDAEKFWTDPKSGKLFVTDR